jgi:hypothetical protein
MGGMMILVDGVAAGVERADGFNPGNVGLESSFVTGSRVGRDGLGDVSHNV